MNAIDAGRNELARVPGHALDELDNIIASPDFSRLPHMMGMQRENLTAFLTALSDDLDEVHTDAMRAPGVPTLTQAIEAAKRAQPTVEADRQDNAPIGDSTETAQESTAVASRRSSIPPEMLGKSAPHIGTQSFTTTPMRWTPASTIHQTEGRSL